MDLPVAIAVAQLVENPGSLFLSPNYALEDKITNLQGLIKKKDEEVRDTKVQLYRITLKQMFRFESKLKNFNVRKKL